MQPLTPTAANWGDTIQGLWEGPQEATGPPGPALPPPAAPTDTHLAFQPSEIPAHPAHTFCHDLTQSGAALLEVS